MSRVRWEALTILAALALRTLQVLQYPYVDEHLLFENFFTFLSKGTILPSHCNYPTLFSYLITPPTWLYLHAGLPGGPQSLADLHASMSIEHLAPLLPARGVALLAAVVTLLLTAALARSAGCRLGGAPAVAAVGVCFVHAERSAYALPDVPLAACATLAAWAAVRWLAQPRPAWMALSWVAVGLATSTKYNGAIMAALPATACLLGAVQHPERRRAALQALPLAALAVVAFVVGSPGWILDPQPFIEGFLHESRHVSGGHPGEFGLPYLTLLQRWWRIDSTLLLWLGLGLGVPLLAAARRSAALMVLVLPSWLAVALIGGLAKQSPHYLLMVLPLLAVCGQWLLEELAVRAMPQRWELLAGWVAVALLLVPAWHCAGQAVRQLWLDSREVARVWFESEVPSGSRVLIETTFTPRLLSLTERERFLRVVSAPWLHEELERRPAYEISVSQGAVEQFAVERMEWYVSPSWVRNTWERTALPPRTHIVYERYLRYRQLYRALDEGREPPGMVEAARFAGEPGPELVVYRRR